VSDLAEADPAGSAAAAEPAANRLLRDRSGVQRVTNIELFFDLVYVFAVTQLSHYLLGHSTVPGALQAALLALAADAIPALALAACAAALVTAVAATDRLPWLPRPAGLPGGDRQEAEAAAPSGIVTYQ